MLKPLDDRVVVKPIKTKNESEGGIVIPDVAKDRPTRGEVLAIGEGRLLDSGVRAPVDVSVGDQVLFGKYVGQEIDFEGETFLILRENDLIATVS